MEERLGEMSKKGEEREDDNWSHSFFKSSVYDKLELKHKNFFFFKLIECIIKMSWCETECKNMCH